MWRQSGPAPRPPAAEEKTPVKPSVLPTWSRSIAVLPFKNIGGDPEQEYFCDGITEQLISNLTHLRELKVIARTTVMRYKNSPKDVRQIGKELGVGTLLEGSVQKAGTRIRINARLVDTTDGSYLWSQSYDRKLEDIFAVQDEVAREVARSLELNLTGHAAESMKTPEPANPEAYDAYLKSRHIIDAIYMRTHDEQDFQKAMAYAKRAVALDPSYPLAYIALAYAYEGRYEVTGDPQARAHLYPIAKQALAVAPDSAAVQSVMGYALLQRGEYDRAFPYLKKALESNPNNKDTLLLFGVFYTYLGLYHEAEVFYSRIIELDPLEYHAYLNRAIDRFFVGELKKAEADVETVASLNPTPLLQNFQTFLYAQTGRMKKARRLIESFDPRFFPTYRKWTLAIYWAKKGNAAKALGYFRSSDVYALLGMKEEALKQLAVDVKENVRFNYLSLKGYPALESLRDDPRFAEILAAEKRKYEARKIRYRLD